MGLRTVEVDWDARGTRGAAEQIEDFSWMIARFEGDPEAKDLDPAKWPHVAALYLPNMSPKEYSRHTQLSSTHALIAFRDEDEPWRVGIAPKGEAFGTIGGREGSPALAIPLGKQAMQVVAGLWRPGLAYPHATVGLGPKGEKGFGLGPLPGISRLRLPQFCPNIVLVKPPADL